MELKTDFGKYNVVLKRSSYRNNGVLAVLMETDDGEPFATLTVNIEGWDSLPHDMSFVDTNNCDWAVKFLKDNKIAESMGVYASSGFCSYPLYKFDLSKIEEDI